MTRRYWIPTLLTFGLFGAVLFWAVEYEENEVQFAQAPEPFGVSDFDSYALRDGAREARQLLEAGRMRIVTYGYPMVLASEYQRVLRETYQIEELPIAGCVVSKGVLTYAREFNAVMEPAIEARYGADVFDRVADEAQNQWEERQMEAGRLSRVVEAEGGM